MGGNVKSSVDRPQSSRCKKSVDEKPDQLLPSLMACLDVRNLHSVMETMGIILAIVGTALVINLPKTQMSIYVFSIVLFMGSILGFGHMLRANVKPSDLGGHQDIAGITGIEFIATITMLLKYYATDLFSTAVFGAIASFIPAICGFFIPLMREKLQEHIS